MKAAYFTDTYVIVPGLILKNSIRLGGHLISIPIFKQYNVPVNGRLEERAYIKNIHILI
jgi:hypothetical protein